ncbi:hypothetical protein Glove_269g40 [Diversispora epigaea]|uniref:Uncharacterized protein n=1 Tax=Diversispora epigaea TaxID=1348612 RepID=A0A397ICR3_9GLOM|nr:hypothetical protein Glove_269g40 [Diversispora epigaea]
MVFFIAKAVSGSRTRVEEYKPYKLLEDFNFINFFVSNNSSPKKNNKKQKYAVQESQVITKKETFKGLQDKHPNHEIIKDIGSGFNYKFRTFSTGYSPSGLAAEWERMILEEFIVLSRS